MFQHTAARRRLAIAIVRDVGDGQFQHTAARRRLGRCMALLRFRLCFNTQPPEGGWSRQCSIRADDGGFNTQPPEGGWDRKMAPLLTDKEFQHTAARRRLGIQGLQRLGVIAVSTHSRPKAAGASLKSLVPSGFAAPISLSSQEKREREYNTAFSVTPAFAIY